MEQNISEPLRPEQLTFAKPTHINYEYIAFMLLAFLILLKSPDLYNVLRGTTARVNSIRRNHDQINQSDV